MNADPQQVMDSRRQFLLAENSDARVLGFCWWDLYTLRLGSRKDIPVQGIQPNGLPGPDVV